MPEDEQRQTGGAVPGEAEDPIMAELRAWVAEQAAAQAAEEPAPSTGVYSDMPQLRGGKLIPLSKNKIIIHGPGGLGIRRPGKDNAVDEVVVDCKFEVVKALDVDGRTYWRVRLENREAPAMHFDAIKEKLKDMGRVMNPKEFPGVLAAALTAGPAPTEAHATFGVYDEGRVHIEVCDDPVPVKPAQAEAWHAVRGHVARTATKDQVQAYVDFVKHWHPYEVLPALGLGLAAPFTPVLRGHGIMVPHLFAWGEPDLGKSLTERACSEKMWGTRTISGPTIATDYRLAAHLDSICLPVTVEEADQMPEKLWSMLKESAERWLVTERGDPKLEKMEPYHGRAVLMMNGNAIPFGQEATLKRILAVRFDASARAERRQTAGEVDEKFDALQPVGHQVLRWFVENLKTRAALLALIRTLKKEIHDARPSWKFEKRPEAWAVAYLGLKMFEAVCRGLGIDWRAPSTADFVRDVVNPIEEATWEIGRGNASRFASWFANDRTRRLRRDKMCEACGGHGARMGAECPECSGTGRVSGTIQGENEIFRRGSVDVDEKDVEGWWVTAAVLDAYNKQAGPGEKVASLPELNRQAANEAGIPLSAVTRAGGKSLKEPRMGGRSKKAAFVADVLESPGRTMAEEAEKPGGGAGEPQDPMDKALEELFGRGMEGDAKDDQPSYDKPR